MRQSYVRNNDSSLHNNRHKASIKIQTVNSAPNKYLTTPSLRSFYFTPITAAEIITTIGSFKNKPSDISSIPLVIYKEFAHKIAPILADVYNECVK